MVYDGLMGCGDHSADFPVWCEESKAEDSSGSGLSGGSAYGETRSRLLFNCNCGNLGQNCKLAATVLLVYWIGLSARSNRTSAAAGLQSTDPLPQ